MQPPLRRTVGALRRRAAAATRCELSSPAAAGDTALDLYASALVFVHHTITLETLLLVAVAVGVTNFFCRYEYDGRLLSANVNWVFFR